MDTDNIRLPNLPVLSSVPKSSQLLFGPLTFRCISTFTQILLTLESFYLFKVILDISALIHYILIFFLNFIAYFHILRVLPVAALMY